MHPNGISMNIKNPNGHLLSPNEHWKAIEPNGVSMDTGKANGL